MKKPFRLVVNNPTLPFQISGVYLITDHGDNLIERVNCAMRGGVSVLQYRAKEKGHEECLPEARQLQKICRDFGIAFIINDSIELALQLDADGVHLGQDDGSIRDARARLGADKIIGKSTHNLQEAIQAEEEGANYIGFGAIYPTESKSVTLIPGTAGLAEIREKIRLPIVAIGGITISNACRVLDAGADAIAVISSVLSSPRPDIATAELKLLFNRSCQLPRGAVLTLAGSDSGGGAGIQADIKTISLLGSYAASAITALTAQNTRSVASIYSLPPSFVIDQLDTVLSDIHIDVIKTGMLHTPAIISAIAEYVSGLRTMIPMIIDPVMVATNGGSLMESEAVKLYTKQLLPQAYLLTPNIPEAEKLLGISIKNEFDMEQAAMELHSLGAANVLVKGGHLTGNSSTDILYDGKECHRLHTERIFTANTHGTGCTCASAIATYLAQGEPLSNAVKKSKEFITSAIQSARPIGKGHSPVNHFAAAQFMLDKA